MKFINKNELIITKTPLRVSLFGGGTDYPEHFLKHGGLTINFAIDKYNYIILKKSKELTNKKYLLSYSKKETTNLIKQIKHPSIRECLKYFKINKRLEIHHIADLQSKTGLGSSSSFTVGLIKALIKLVLPTALVPYSSIPFVSLPKQTSFVTYSSLVCRCSIKQ